MAEEKSKNKGDVELMLSQKTNNSLKTHKYYCNLYIVCIFLFTALIQCTLCRDCILYL